MRFQLKIIRKNHFLVLFSFFYVNFGIEILGLVVGHGDYNTLYLTKKSSKGKQI